MANETLIDPEDKKVKRVDVVKTTEVEIDEVDTGKVKRGRGRPRKKRGPKPKSQRQAVGTSSISSISTSQDTAPKLKEPGAQTKERWRQLVNIIPEASVWVSD